MFPFHIFPPPIHWLNMSTLSSCSQTRSSTKIRNQKNHAFRFNEPRFSSSLLPANQFTLSPFSQECAFHPIPTFHINNNSPASRFSQVPQSLNYRLKPWGKVGGWFQLRLLAAVSYSSHTVNIWGHARGHISLFLVDYRCCDRQLRAKCSIFRNDDGAIESFYCARRCRTTHLDPLPLTFNCINFKFVFDIQVNAPAPVGSPVRAVGRHPNYFCFWTLPKRLNSHFSVFQHQQNSKYH